MTRFARAAALLGLLHAGCSDDGTGPAGGVDQGPPLDATATADADAAPPTDLRSPDDLATTGDGPCVPNMGPGCCYATCMIGEQLVCHGKNICGYPCECVAAPDAGVPEVFVGKFFVGQDCQPIVAPDPVSAFIQVFFTNRGNADIGPVHFYSGRIVDDKSGKTLLTFQFKPLKDIVIPANSHNDYLGEKSSGSGVPANGCNTLACKSMVRVVAEWGPPGGKATHSISSEAIAVSCVF